MYDSSDLENIDPSLKVSQGWEIPEMKLPGGFNHKKRLFLSKLTLIPTKIELMQVKRISKDCHDLNWLFENMSRFITFLIIQKIML